MVGAAERDRPGRHRRLHPPRLVRPPPRQPRARRARRLPAAARPGTRHRPAGACGLPYADPVHALGGDLHDLQAGRPYPQGAPPDLPAGLRSRRTVQPEARHHRQPRLGRSADPRAGLPGPAGDHAGGQPGRLPGPRARVDAVVLRTREQVGVRRGRGLLRRPGRPHLRDRDRAVQRPADEPAGVLTGQIPAGQQLGRAFATRTRPGGDVVHLRPRLLLGEGGAADWRRFRRHRRVLPGGGQIPPRRAPQVRGRLRAGREQAVRQPVPELRQGSDDRRTAPG